MKGKVYLFLLICLLSVVTLKAQRHYTSDVSVGAKGGINLSHMFFNPSVKQGWPVNPTFGVRIRYVEEKNFGLIGEVNWVRRGWSENFEGLPFRYSRMVDFINIPLLAHIYFGTRMKFFANLGPEVSFKIGDSYSANFDPFDTKNIPDFPNTNRRNTQMTERISQKIDFGISAGLGFEYYLNPRNAVDFEARYYFGLSNLVPSGRQDTFRSSNMMTIAFTVGYWFKLK